MIKFSSRCVVVVLFAFTAIMLSVLYAASLIFSDLKPFTDSLRVLEQSDASCICRDCVGIRHCGAWGLPPTYGICLEEGSLQHPTCEASSEFRCGMWSYDMEKKCGVKGGESGPLSASALSSCINRKFPVPANGFVILPYHKIDIACYTSSDVVCRSLQRAGEWETLTRRVLIYALEKLLEDYPEQEVRGIDVGAHVGSLGLSVWKAGFPVDIFEASPLNMQMISLSACLNRADTVRVYHTALGSQTGSGCMLLSSSMNIGHFVTNCSERWKSLEGEALEEEKNRTGMKLAFRIPITTLDKTYMSKNTHRRRSGILFNKRKFAMKISADNYELEIIKGGKSFFSSPQVRPFVVISKMWKTFNIQEYCTLMFSFGYRAAMSLSVGSWIDLHDADNCVIHMHSLSEEVDTLVFAETKHSPYVLEESASISEAIRRYGMGLFLTVLVVAFVMYRMLRLCPTAGGLGRP